MASRTNIQKELQRTHAGDLDSLVENVSTLTDTQTVSGVNTFSGANQHTAANTFTSTVQVQGLATLSTLGNASGSDLADNTTAVSLSSSYAGQTVMCALDGAAKTVNLPANVAAADIGTRIKIVQAVGLVASGVLTVTAGLGNTMSINSWIAGTAVANYRNTSAALTTLTITGANTNSAWGAGSVLDCTVVAAGVWLVEGTCLPLGAGNNAAAWS
jgi:hypothetical protein